MSIFDNEAVGEVIDSLHTDNEPPPIALATQWLEAKATEQAANKKRRELEDMLTTHVEHHATLDGSKTDKTSVPHFKITTKDEPKAKLSEGSTWGDFWQVLHDAGIADDDMPIKLQRTVDMKKLGALKEANPEAYAALVPLIETYAARPSFKIEAV
jgi:hypothetical protein